jgi:putative NIF3 family GTP cyclohydrolase 1 type 2
VDGYPEGCGYGRLGNLPGPLTPGELCDHVSDVLGYPSRLVANPDPATRVEQVVVLGGSGGSFVREAATSGAGAYITGDLDYHDALLAESLKLIAIDAGHAATELPSLQPLAKRLTELVDIPVSVSEVRR